ncbi:DNA phosphorothioation-dependent restriction protein DptG [Priestia megaterium]
MSSILKFDRDSIKKEFKVIEDRDKKLRLTHTSGSNHSMYKIFPYSASDNIVSDFDAIIGNYSRLVTEKKYTPFNKESLYQEVRSKVTTDFIEKLNVIINELFFDENDQLVLSHPLFFNYLSEEGNVERKVGEFLSIVFSSVQIQGKLKKAYEKQPDNVLLRLIYECLPDLKIGEKEKSGSYMRLIDDIFQVFEEDLLFLLENEDLFIKSFKHLLLYYYFFYTTQVILNLDKMFKINQHHIIPTYFNVDWEQRSKTRDSFKQGWKMVSPKLPKLFSHVNCIMMLNHIKGSIDTPITYVSIKEATSRLTFEQQEGLRKDIEEWHKDYRTYTGDVNWDGISPLPFVEGEPPLLREIRELQHSIAYQFTYKVSSRYRAAQKYYEGYEQLAKLYFLKRSGSLGYTFNLNQEFTIFLTRICIKDKKKLSIKELFEQLQLRGIYFDRDTKKQVVSLYERLNMLEKKSDSGDAQYVKYIL